MAWKRVGLTALVLAAIASCLDSRVVVSSAKSPDPIQEDYGARVSAYGGFLELPAALYPEGYKEKSHHYSKTEYVLYLNKQIGGESYDLDIIESSLATLLAPETGYVETFVYRGAEARTYRYQNPKTGRQSIWLLWMNPPKQRLSISVEQVPSQIWTPERLVRLLERMTVAAGEPAFEQPAPHQ